MPIFYINGDITLKTLKNAIVKEFKNYTIKICDSIPKESSNNHLITITENISFDDIDRERENNINEMKALQSDYEKQMISLHKDHQKLLTEFSSIKKKYEKLREEHKNVIWKECQPYNPKLKFLPSIENDKVVEESEKVIGGYTISNTLGEGQYAVVKSCKEKFSKAEWAIKIFTKDRISNLKNLIGINSEIENLKLLKSDHIIGFKEAIQTNSKLYLIIEKGGPDLFVFFETFPSGVNEVMSKSIIYNIFVAVKFCHDNKICHRDLKPEVHI